MYFCSDSTNHSVRTFVFAVLLSPVRDNPNNNAFSAANLLVQLFCSRVTKASSLQSSKRATGELRSPSMSTTVCFSRFRFVKTPLKTLLVHSCFSCSPNHRRFSDHHFLAIKTTDSAFLTVNRFTCTEKMVK